jgi:oligopeptidase B
LNSLNQQQVDEIGRSYRLYRHTLGENATDGSDDELIYEETDPLFVLLISVTANKKYLLLHVNGQITSETWFLPSNQPKGQFQLVHMMYI